MSSAALSTYYFSINFYKAYFILSIEGLKNLSLVSTSFFKSENCVLPLDFKVLIIAPWIASSRSILDVYALEFFLKLGT